MLRRLSTCNVKLVDYNINTHYGVNTRFGWFAIPKKCYARDWTESAVDEYIRSKIPDIENNISKKIDRDQIQQLINEWSLKVKSRSRPKAESYIDPEIKKSLEFTINDERMGSYRKYKYKKEIEDKDLMAEKLKQKILTQKQAQQIILQKKEDKENCFANIYYTGVVGEDFKDSYVNLYLARVHYTNKWYTTPGFDKSNWSQLSHDEKERERLDCIELMKNCLMYRKGELVPLKGNFNANSKNIVKSPKKKST